MSQLSDRFAALYITATVTYSEPSDNPSVRLDLDGDHEIGRITIWRDGSFYSEALRVEEGKQVHSQHGRIENESEINSAIETLLDVFSR